MPIYEYSCDKCRETVEILQRLSDPGPDTHDRCGGTLHRLVSAPRMRVKENDGLTGSTHSSILRADDNAKSAASKRKK